MNSRLAGAGAACEAALTELSSQLQRAHRPVMVAAWSHGVGSNEGAAARAGVVGNDDAAGGERYESVRGLSLRVNGRSSSAHPATDELQTAVAATTHVTLARTTGHADTHLAEAAVEWALL